MSDEEFAFSAPPSFQEQTGFMPPSQDAAWILELIKINLDNTSLPDEIKKSLLCDMVPYINNASMTKITKGQVAEFLGGFRELWLRYRVYKVTKKYVKELNYVMAYIRELLLMNLNKSVEGWQGDHVFERKASTDMRLIRRDYIGELKRGFFRKKEKTQERKEGYD